MISSKIPGPNIRAKMQAASKFKKLPSSKVTLKTEHSQNPFSRTKKFDTKEILWKKKKDPTSILGNSHRSYSNKLSTSRASSCSDKNSKYFDGKNVGKPDKNSRSDKKNILVSQCPQTIQMIGIFFHFRDMNKANHIKTEFINHGNHSRTLNAPKKYDLQTIEELTEKPSSWTGRLSINIGESIRSSDRRCNSLEQEHRMTPSVKSISHVGRNEAKSHPNIYCTTPSSKNQQLLDSAHKIAAIKKEVPQNDFDPMMSSEQLNNEKSSQNNNSTSFENYFDAYEQRNTMVVECDKRITNSLPHSSNNSSLYNNSTKPKEDETTVLRSFEKNSIGPNTKDEFSEKSSLKNRKIKIQANYANTRKNSQSSGSLSRERMKNIQSRSNSLNKNFSNKKLLPSLTKKRRETSNKKTFLNKNIAFESLAKLKMSKTSKNNKVEHKKGSSFVQKKAIMPHQVFLFGNSFFNSFRKHEDRVKNSALNKSSGLSYSKSFARNYSVTKRKNNLQQKLTDQEKPKFLKKINKEVIIYDELQREEMKTNLASKRLNDSNVVKVKRSNALKNISSLRYSKKF